MNNGTATFNVVSFGASLITPTGDLYIDTNSWIDIALNRPPAVNTELYFRNFAVQNPNDYMLWSPHTEDEVLQTLQVDEYAREAQIRHVRREGNKPAWKVLENNISKSDAAILHQRALQKLDILQSQFQDWVYPIENYNVMRTAREIMRLYGVPFKDAKHLAFMWHEQVNNIFTNDHGFSRVPGLNVYSTTIGSNGHEPFPFSSFMPALAEKSDNTEDHTT